jgi:hypothetical protein
MTNTIVSTLKTLLLDITSMTKCMYSTTMRHHGTILYSCRSKWWYVPVDRLWPIVSHHQTEIDNQEVYCKDMTQTLYWLHVATFVYL